MVNEKKELGVEKLYSKRSVASFFMVSPCTIDRLRKAGELHSVLVRGQVRIKESEIKRFIDEAGSCKG